MALESSVRAVEYRWLSVSRWLLPLFLGILFPALNGLAWFLILLDPSLWPTLDLGSIALPAILGVGVGFALVHLWGRSVRRVATPWRWSILLALLLVVLAEVGVRQPTVTDAFWAAVGARVQDKEEFFIREAALFRRMALTNNRVTQKPRLQVFGTSQLIVGVDYDLLQNLRPDIQVERRSVAGMCPARMLMTVPFLGARAGDTLVVYWSEFDMGGATALDVDWYRAFANGSGLRAVLGLLPDGEWRKNIRRSVELFWGCASELWRGRDGWRLLAGRAVGEMRQAEARIAEADGPREQGTGYASGLENEPYFQMGLESAKRLVQQWRGSGAEVIVLEGAVNPSIHHERTPERRLQTRLFLEEVCRTTGARYIPSEAQAFVPSAQDWKDGTHFNEEARIAFTRYLATLLPLSSPGAH